MNPMMHFLTERRVEAQRARQSYEQAAAKLLKAGVIVEIERGTATYEATVAQRGDGSTACVSGGRVYVVGDSGKGYWVGIHRVRDFVHAQNSNVEKP